MLPSVHRALADSDDDDDDEAEEDDDDRQTTCFTLPVGDIESDVSPSLGDIYRTVDAVDEEAPFVAADYFIFDSVRIHFNFYVFLQQYLIHALLPVSIVLSPNQKAQTFHERSVYAFCANYFFPALMGIMIACYLKMKMISTSNLGNSYDSQQSMFDYNNTAVGAEGSKHDDFEFFQGSIWYPLLFYCLYKVRM